MQLDYKQWAGSNLGKMAFECEFCHYDFSGNTELDKHLMDIHETVENIDRFLEKESKIFKNYNTIHAAVSFLKGNYTSYFNHLILIKNLNLLELFDCSIIFSEP